MKISRKLFVATVLITITATVTAAEKVVVRSGDHDTFSRFVVYLPQRTGWSLSGTSRTKELTLTEGAIEWDISQIFKRMSDKRISNIKALVESTGLSFELNCRCDVEVFWHGKYMLVVDVKDPKFQDQGAASLSDTVKDVEVRKFKLADFDQPTRALDLTFHQETALKLAEESLNSSQDIFPDSARPARIDAVAAGQAITRELARAVTVGLVEADLSRANITSDLLEESTKYPRVSAEIEAGFEDNLSPDGILSYTSADPIFNTYNHTSILANELGECISDDLVSIQNWGKEVPFSSQISAARLKLTEENLQDYREGSVSLARLYLYYGFGAEAKQIINKIRQGGVHSEIYIAISDLIDDGKTESDVFSWQAGCDGDVAIWSILSTADEQFENSLNINAALRSLDAFPLHLKELIGPRLVKRLRENDQIVESERVVHTMRGAIDSSKFIYLGIRGKGKAVEESEAALLSVVSNNTEDSLLALIELIDGRLANNADVPLGWVDLASAYTQEQRETEIGEALYHRYIRGLAAVGQYETAFDAIDDLTSKPLNDDIKRSADVILSYTARNADDVTFLKYLGYRGDLTQMNISDLVENEVAVRLLELGFPLEAQNYLSGNANGRHQDARRSLRAKALLAMGRPKDAIGSLLGMRGFEVDALRAEASDQLGDHMAASSLYRATRDNDGALRQALLAEDWRGAARLAAPDLASIIEIPDQSNEVEGDSASLARGNKLLAESESVRDGISRLLEASEVSIDMLD